MRPSIKAKRIAYSAILLIPPDRDLELSIIPMKWPMKADKHPG
jgi:hypothetical protein